MKLSRTQSNFGDFVVLRRQRWYRWLWSIITLTIIPRYAGYELLENVLEADDSTGLVVRQQVNKQGDPLYINVAGDTIALDNTIKILLLLPDLRTHFLREFVPKTEQTFVEGLTIIRTNATETLQLPREQDDGETFIMKGGYDG